MQVKIFQTSSADSAQNLINAWLSRNPAYEIIDIKVAGDGHSVVLTYLIIYKLHF